MSLSSPLRVGQNRRVTLFAANNRAQPVVISQVQFVFPVGTDPTDLMADAAQLRDFVNVHVGQPGALDWTLSASPDGTVVVTPPGGSYSLGPGQQLEFMDVITVNDTPGTATLSVVETASAPGVEAVPATLEFPAKKWAADAGIRLFSGPGIPLPFYENFTLIWEADPGCTLTLSGAGEDRSVAAPNGVAEFDHLVQPTEFTLTAEYPAAGLNDAWRDQKSVTIEVESDGIADFVARPEQVQRFEGTTIVWVVTPGGTSKLTYGDRTVDLGSQVAGSVPIERLERTTTFTLQVSYPDPLGAASPFQVERQITAAVTNPVIEHFAPVAAEIVYATGADRSGRPVRGTATLSWQTRGSGCTIEPGGHTGLPPSGTLVVTPEQPETTYTLTVELPSPGVGTEQAQTTVTVVKPQVGSFSAPNPALVDARPWPELSWSVSGTGTVTVAGSQSAVGTDFQPIPGFGTYGATDQVRIPDIGHNYQGRFTLTAPWFTPVTAEMEITVYRDTA